MSLSNMHMIKNEQLKREKLEQIEKNEGYCPAFEEKVIENICPCMLMQEQDKCPFGLYILNSVEREN